MATFALAASKFQGQPGGAPRLRLRPANDEWFQKVMHCLINCSAGQHSLDELNLLLMGLLSWKQNPSSI